MSLFGPWALNQFWKELPGQAKGSSALKDLNFKKGYNLGNFGALIDGVEIMSGNFSFL
jgi:hypothetical protein